MSRQQQRSVKEVHFLHCFPPVVYSTPSCRNLKPNAPIVCLRKYIVTVESVYWTEPKATCRQCKNQPNAYNMYTDLEGILSACLYLCVSFYSGVVNFCRYLSVCLPAYLFVCNRSYSWNHRYSCNCGHSCNRRYSNIQKETTPKDIKVTPAV